MTVGSRRSELLTSCAGVLGLLSFNMLATAPAAAGTPSSCPAMTSFTFPNTTINSATNYPEGPYVASDTWALAFTDLPAYCDVYATIKPTADSAINVHVWMPTGGGQQPGGGTMGAY